MEPAPQDTRESCHQFDRRKSPSNDHLQQRYFGAFFGIYVLTSHFVWISISSWHVSQRFCGLKIDLTDTKGRICVSSDALDPVVYVYGGKEGDRHFWNFLNTTTTMSSAARGFRSEAACKGSGQDRQYDRPSGDCASQLVTIDRLCFFSKRT